LHVFGLPEQAPPGTQSMQAPLPLQTRLVPQLAPAALFASSTQVRVPVVHEPMPLLQAFGLFEQAPPGVQATQLPALLQTMLVPQPVPAAFIVPFTHVDLPVEHEAVPLKQGFGLPEQLWPGVHIPQKPLPSQTRLVPQDMPAAMLVALSTQTDAPVAHETTPALHGDGLPLHAPPAVHGTHVPAPLHTRLVPQPVPGALAVPSTHAWTPVLHEVTPFTHAPPGFAVHACPAVHTVHCALALHT